jgi:heat shock protein HtpX
MPCSGSPGRPSLLASALVRINGEMSRIPTRDLRAAEPLNAFFFAPAIAPGFSFSSLFATHPSLDRRLEQLARLEAELGRRA